MNGQRIGRMATNTVLIVLFVGDLMHFLDSVFASLESKRKTNQPSQ